LTRAKRPRRQADPVTHATITRRTHSTGGLGDQRGSFKPPSAVDGRLRELIADADAAAKFDKFSCVGWRFGP